MSVVVCRQFAVEVIRGPKLQKMSTEINKPVSLAALSSFAPVIEFLHGAGQSQLISQVDYFKFFITVCCFELLTCLCLTDIAHLFLFR